MLLLLANLAALSTVGQAKPSEPIIVTGRRISDYSAKLRACLARKCSTDEDIDASLALAESQIVAGKYRDARSTLLASLKRNKGEARHYPIPVSDLYRANGKVAAHLGFDNDYYTSTWGIYRTLKAGLPSDEVRHFSALMEVAEMMGKTRGHERARIYYADIAAQARKAGRPDIAAMAELRSILRHYEPGVTRDAAIERIANSTTPEMRGAALEAKLALAKIAYEQGDERKAAEIQRQFATMDLKQPILIYAPTYEMLEQAVTNGSQFAVAMSGGGGGGAAAAANGGSSGKASTGRGGGTSVLPYAQWSTTSRITATFDDMWIDVGFNIGPDGRVKDMQVLRKRGDTFWAKPLLASIEGRRYTPGKVGDPASTRVERYTYTSAYDRQTGSHLVDRSPDGRVEYFDFSPMGITASN